MKIACLEFHSHIKLSKGYCPKCKMGDLKQSGWGIFDSPVFICPKCETVFKLKLIKMREKNVNKEYLKKFLNELKEKDE